jgi:UDP-N-acetylglucosamine--dolichyl-phosphate N-acetylglucosaminephosphotransferase
MERVIFPSVLISFAVTWIATRKWIRKAPEIGLIGLDMNKPGKPKVPEMGGICVVFGFTMGILLYIGLMTFYLQRPDYVNILAALCTVLMTCIIGMMDDILGWKNGLRQWQKPIFTLFAAMPMMVINAGHSTMNLPIIGTVDWGILYPLLIVPIGIGGASNAYNMVAGYNGLEAGMGVIILSILGYIALISSKSNALILCLCMVGALAVFLYFNWYPAKIFPGDTMTYAVGALMAFVAILGDMEKIAIFLFIPYLLDFVLQMHSGFKAEAFSKVNEDGSLEMPGKGIYHLTHLAIAVLKRVKQKVYERDVVLFVCGIEATISVIVLASHLI